MSLEIIPDDYQAPYNPVALANHDAAASYLYARVFEKNDIRKTIQYLLKVQKRHSLSLVEAIFEHGKYVEVTQEIDGEVSFDEDFMRARTFMTGMTVALVALDALAYEMDIDRQEWREVWLARQDFIKDVGKKRLEKLSPREAYDLRGQSIIELGHRALSTIHPAYVKVVDEIDSNAPGLVMTGNIFKASFGYVFDAGKEAMNDIIRERDIYIITPTTKQLDEELKMLVGRSSRKPN